jgi:hypothetical protein
MKASKTKNQESKKKKGTVYLTRRVLVRAASPAFREAAKEAMRIKGYVIKAENGWVVREDSNGTITRLSPIEPVTRPLTIALD